MATAKTTKEPQAATGATNAPAAVGTKVRNDRWVYIPESERTDDQKKMKKLAPQAQTISNAVEAAKKGGVLREDLIKGLTGVLVTRQPVGRILSYYQKELQEKGFVRIS